MTERVGETARAAALQPQLATPGDEVVEARRERAAHRRGQECGGVDRSVLQPGATEVATESNGFARPPELVGDRLAVLISDAGSEPRH
jgi:hypothetical protein